MLSIGLFVCFIPFERALHAEFSLLNDIREDAKQFQSVDICCGEKVHKHVGMWANPLCNRLSNWCRKLPKMMDLDASPELLILVKKPSECLNSLFELIYFLLTFNIFGFRRMRSQNLTWKKCCARLFCYPKILTQNSRFRKNCWLFVESPASSSGEKFSSTLGHVRNSIHRILVILISFQCGGITQI